MQLSDVPDTLLCKTCLYSGSVYLCKITHDNPRFCMYAVPLVSSLYVCRHPNQKQFSGNNSKPSSAISLHG